MPADIQFHIERVIKSTLDDHWRVHGCPPQDSGNKQSHEAQAVEEHNLEHNLEHLDRILRDLEDRASRKVGEGHCVNAVEHGPVAVNHEDREKRAQFDSRLNQVSVVLGRLEQLHIRFEACSLLRDPAAPSVSAPSAEDGSLRVHILEKPELFLQSVDHFLNGLFSIVRTVM